MYPYTEKIINSLLTNVVFDMAKYMFGYFWQILLKINHWTVEPNHLQLNKIGFLLSNKDNLAQLDIYFTISNKRFVNRH